MLCCVLRRGRDGFHDFRCPRARLAERAERSADGLLLLRRERSRHRGGDRAARNFRRRPARSCAYCIRSLCLRDPESARRLLPGRRHRRRGTSRSTKGVPIVTGRALRIGELAAASGLTRDALRYYERQGLLPRSRRTSGGFREYDGAAVDRVRFIKQAQAHGLTLREIRDLVSHQSDAGRTRCRHVRDLLARKLTQMEARRQELDAFCDTLRDYLRMCDQALQSRTSVDCPVVENLKAAKRE